MTAIVVLAIIGLVLKLIAMLHLVVALGTESRLRAQLFLSIAFWCLVGVLLCVGGIVLVMIL